TRSKRKSKFQGGKVSNAAPNFEAPFFAPTGLRELALRARARAKLAGQSEIPSSRAGRDSKISTGCLLRQAPRGPQAVAPSECCELGGQRFPRHRAACRAAARLESRWYSRAGDAPRSACDTSTPALRRFPRAARLRAKDYREMRAPQPGYGLPACRPAARPCFCARLQQE